MPLAAVAGVVLALVLFNWVFNRCFGIPPHADTATSMWGVKRRILRYAHEHGELPDNLENLPRIPRLRGKTTDWWGNPIQFEVDSEGIATLSSPGGKVLGYHPREGRPIVRKFPTKGPSGEWSGELVAFISDAVGKTE